MVGIEIHAISLNNSAFVVGVQFGLFEVFIESFVLVTNVSTILSSHNRRKKSNSVSQSSGIS